MKKIYHSPSLDGLGAVQALTAAYGSDPDPDISELPGIPASQGSYDICQQQGGDPTCGT